MRHIESDTSLFRTHHLDSEGRPLFTNQLIHETSPYLLQHAHNPVNWLPWGKKAISRAKEHNMPIFVSIGYATCHYCHVMENESFEDLEIADYLNRNFICVKVDREERPDIDAVYMAALQIFQGNGGWPLNVFLTPSCRPFFGCSYCPPRSNDKSLMTGFLPLIKNIRNAYDNRPEAIKSTSEQLTNAIKEMLTPFSGEKIPSYAAVEKALTVYSKIYDNVNGGIKGAPKFPSSLPVSFLIRQNNKQGGEKYLEMALNTLNKMAQGGIFDHIGGGFHRYSTDEKWLVPHFEKMLYDNALITIPYIEAYQITNEKKFRMAAESTLAFIEKEMRADDGFFYSATDADSMNHEGIMEEGYFFTWSEKEIDDLLPEKKSDFLKTCLSVKGAPHINNRYIPHLTQNEEELAEKFDMSIESFYQDLSQIKSVLYKERSKRKRPLTDTKILTSWNSMVVSAFAKAGSIFKNNDFIKTATDTAEKLVSLAFSNGRLLRIFKDDSNKTTGFLDDHVFLQQAFLDLHETTSDTIWLERALKIDMILETYFEDKKDGGFFINASDNEQLIAREKPYYDQAIPSGNAIAAMNLIRLYNITEKKGFFIRAEKTMKAFAAVIEQTPHAAAGLLTALDMYYENIKNSF